MKLEVRLWVRLESLCLLNRATVLGLPRGAGVGLSLDRRAPVVALDRGKRAAVALRRELAARISPSRLAAT